MEVNSNAREYEPRPVLATGGGVLARLNVATSCSARKDDARHVALILVAGASYRHDGERSEDDVCLPSQVGGLPKYLHT